MKSYIAILGLAAAVVSAPVAWADAVTGTAANVPAAEVSGATKALTQAGNAAIGPLAPSLQGKPLVVRIHADWCSACKATHATLVDLRQTYAGKINYVEFDVTNAKTAAVAHAKAEKLGLGKFYDAAKEQTSAVAVINPQNGKVYATFYNDGNLKDYEGAINHVLKVENE
ncbi:MAG TPA: thioredoxin domain-containing protein [Stellaceae bacterium]|nr:thioredoxin domain-containing protein [Stellaceae bacterium]